MTLSSVQTYTDESLKQCKELMNLLRKRIQIEAEYAKQLSKLSSSILVREEPDDDVRQQVRRTCTWRSLTKYAIHLGNVSETHKSLSNSISNNLLTSFQVLIKEMETVRKGQVDRGLEIEKALQESYSALKKAKNEMENASNAAQDAAYQHTKAKVSNSSKNTDKYQTKLTNANEKADSAADAVRVCEDLCKEAQDLFYTQRLPDLYENIKTSEMERSTTVKRILLDSVFCEKMQAEGRLSEFDLLQEAFSSIDISEDIDEFADTQMNDDLDRSDQTVVSVRSLLNSKKQGRLQLKKGDVISGWKGKYYVFMEDDKLLYCFDNEASIKPRDIIPLPETSIHDLDDSFFGRANCFQLYHTVTRQVYNLAADSAAEKADWMNILRQSSLCCEKIDIITPNYETKPNESDNPESYQIRRNICVEVIEAKELTGVSFTQGTNPYCSVFFDDTKFARTGLRNGDNPFWGDSFEIVNLCPHTKRIRVIVSNHNRLYKDIDIGYASIDILKLTPFKRVEQWWPIITDSDDSMKGQIKIAVELRVDRLLPIRYYSSFNKIVLEPSFKSSRLLSECVGPAKEKLSKMLLSVLICENTAIDGILTLIQEDIDNTETPNVIFRGNTLATKIVDALMKEVGQDYLNDTLGTLVKQVYNSKDSCEVDPTRAEPEVLQKNLKKLLSTASAFWDAIFKSMKKCPPELILLFSGLRKAVLKRWPEAQQQNLPVIYTSVSAFIFLRFFCPAILNPRLFGLASDHPAQNTMRTLTLVAKIIQNLSNMADFGAKEPYMTDCNSLIDSNIDYMKQFLDFLCNESNVTATPFKDSRTVRAGPRRSLEQLYVFYNSNKEPFLNHVKEQAEEPPIKDLIQSLNELELAHNTFTQDEVRATTHSRPTSAMFIDGRLSISQDKQFTLVDDKFPPPIPSRFGRVSASALLNKVTSVATSVVTTNLNTTNISTLEVESPADNKSIRSVHSASKQSIVSSNGSRAAGAANPFVSLRGSGGVASSNKKEGLRQESTSSLTSNDYSDPQNNNSMLSIHFSKKKKDDSTSISGKTKGGCSTANSSNSAVNESTGTLAESTFTTSGECESIKEEKKEGSIKSHKKATSTPATSNPTGSSSKIVTGRGHIVDKSSVHQKASSYVHAHSPTANINLRSANASLRTGGGAAANKNNTLASHRSRASSHNSSTGSVRIADADANIAMKWLEQDETKRTK